MKKIKIAGFLMAVSAASLIMAGCSGAAAQSGQAAAGTEASQTTAAPAVSAPAETEAAGKEPETTAAAETEGQEKPADSGTADSGEDFSRTYGLWRLDGASDTASIAMDGEGSFSAFYADGALEAEGYLEYVQEYENGKGNGRYDMYDRSGEFFAGFYFDSDTQFHIGNDIGKVYIRDDSEYIDTPPALGVLVNTPLYTQFTPIEVNNDYHGGYYYKDLLQDQLTVIVNTAFEFHMQVDESIEEMISRSLELVEPQEAREIVIENHEEQSARFTYPVYYVTWLTGWNEDTVDWTAMVVPTDAYTYVYACGTDADFAEVMKETWYESFENLELVFPSEDQEASDQDYFPIAGSSYYGNGQYLIFFTDWRCARFTENGGEPAEGPWGYFEWDSENYTGYMEIEDETLNMYMDGYDGELMVETEEGSGSYQAFEASTFDPYG